MKTTLYVLLAIIAAVGVMRVMAPDETWAEFDVEAAPAAIELNQSDEALVSLVRSDREQASDITDDEVRSMVREAVALAGGLEGIVNDGDTVVLKVNLMIIVDGTGGIGGLMAMLAGGIVGNPHPERYLVSREVNGLDTDYRVTKAVAELVRELNPSGRILVMEASGSGFTAEKMELMGYTHVDIPYVDEFISMDDSGSGFRDGDMSDLVAVDLGERCLYEETRDGVYFMDVTYYNADVIISLPVLKNHMNAAFTGAIKNVAIGSTPPRIYGNFMGARMTGIDHSWGALNNWLHDYYLVRSVDFVVTDGLQGSQFGAVGMGADSLEHAQMNMRLVLAGRDALAVDTIHALIVGVDPSIVDYMTLLGDEGIGIVDPARINVVGNARVDDVSQHFEFTGGMSARQYPEPSKRAYFDFEAPVVQIHNVGIVNETLVGAFSSDEDLVKLELIAGGVRVCAIPVDGSEGTWCTSTESLGSTDSIEILAYDRYLNCSKTSVSVP